MKRKERSNPVGKRIFHTAKLMCSASETMGGGGDGGGGEGGGFGGGEGAAAPPTLCTMKQRNINAASFMEHVE